MKSLIVNNTIYLSVTIATFTTIIMVVSIISLKKCFDNSYYVIILINHKALTVTSEMPCTKLSPLLSR